MALSYRQGLADVGGGIAGTSATRELLRTGREVTLFEASDAVGGCARSWHRGELTPTVGINPAWGSHADALSTSVDDDENVGHAVIAIALPSAHRVQALAGIEAMDTVKRSRPASYADRVTYPGLLEGERARQAAIDGIELPEEIAGELDAACADAGVSLGGGSV